MLYYIYVSNYTDHLIKCSSVVSNRYTLIIIFLHNIFLGGRRGCEELTNVQIITVLTGNVSILHTVIQTEDEHVPAPCKYLPLYLHRSIKILLLLLLLLLL